MNKNYQLAVEYELGIKGEKNYRKAYEHYLLAIHEGNVESRKKVKYKKISSVHIILIVASVILGVLIDVFFDYSYRGLILFSTSNVIISIIYHNKYWYKTGFAYIFNYILLIIISVILLPISFIYPYISGITWIPVVLLFTVSLFTAFSTLVIKLLDREKNVLHFLIISIIVLLLSTASFFIDTQDKRFSFNKVDDGVIITGYRSSETHLVVPEKLSGYPVVGIENNAFRNIQFETIILNDNIKYIGNSAFSGNRVLEEIIIPDGISLGSSVFADNFNLKNVKLPRDLEIIEDKLFYNNFSLEEIKIPQSVKSIGDQAFKYSGLKYIDLPNNLEVIGDEALSYTKITEVEFPESLTYLGSLSNIINLETLNIPSNIKTIPNKFLDGNKVIEEFIVPEQIVKVGSYAFANSNIKNVLFTDNVSDIGEGLFYNNQAITEIRLPKSIYEIPAFTFANSSIEAFEQGSNIVEIGNAAFLNASKLKSITFSTGLKTIGSEVFTNNISLEEVILPDSVTTIGSNTFRGAYNLKKVVLSRELSSIPTNLFYNARNLTEVNLPDNIEIIGVDSFRNANLVNVTLPENLIKISDGAFYGNVNLKSITFNDKLQEIGVYSFGNNKSLVEVDLPKELIKLGEYSFYGNVNLEKIIFNSNVKFVGHYALKTNGNTKIILDESLTFDNWDPEWNPDELEIIIK